VKDFLVMALTPPRLIAAALLTSVLVLTGCSPSASSSGGGAPDPGAELTVGLRLEPTNLDIRHTTGAAIEQVLMDNVYEGLVARTPENEIVSSLASEFDVSDDGLTYSFVLRDGVTFHDGTPLTSADVVSSFTTVKDDVSVAGHRDFADVGSISAPDPSSVSITMTTPNQNFLFALTGPAGVILKDGDSTDMTISANGTGPFTLASWKTGDSIQLSRNDDYWGEPAGVATVNVQYIPDPSAGVNAMLDGSLDVLLAVEPDLAPTIEGVDGITVTRGETTAKGTLAFNNARAPLDDVRVREALRLAIDHDGLVAARGAGDTLYGPIPPQDPGYEDLSDAAPYDPERAKRLLAEAGHEDLTLTLSIPSVYGTTVSNLLVSDFDEIGVDLTVDSIDFAAWVSDVFTNHDYDLSFVLHVEPRDFGNFANPDYYFGYDNAEVQGLYAEALAAPDADRSASLLAEAARIVSDDHAADWLYVDESLAAVSPQVTGFTTDAVNFRIDLASVSKTG
jgi:peptide/nickel transport system substrate-binding protein